VTATHPSLAPDLGAFSLPLVRDVLKVAHAPGQPVYARYSSVSPARTASSFAATVTVVPDDYANWNATSHQRVVQEVSSLSSIEKILPVSILMFRTTQLRPFTSVNLASYMPGSTPVMRNRSS
jgi:hypothetical protein